MKKLMVLLLGLIMLSGVMAINEPEQQSVENLLSTVGQPVPPSGSGDTTGECDYPDIKEETCEGDVKHYELCLQTASGGVWTARSENCEQYEKSCVAGKCVSESEKGDYYLKIGIAIAVILFILWIIFKKK